MACQEVRIVILSSSYQKPKSMLDFLHQKFRINISNSSQDRYPQLIRDQDFVIQRFLNKERDAPELWSPTKFLSLQQELSMAYVCPWMLSLSQKRKIAKSGLHQQDHFQRLTCTRRCCRPLLCKNS